MHINSRQIILSANELVRGLSRTYLLAVHHSHQSQVQKGLGSSPDKVEEILQHHDPSIVNQIEPQFRQPSLYFAALVPGDDDAAELIKLLIRNGANVKFKDHN